ncbi:hypothetical protein A3C91_04975 [Candidatus Azambacteria bacterium RIFCSPHIGHO2_02_FULL_52_12]|uniref:Outer membrane protein beta-barrel domain-containing protein n=1 Tax=Candidatus Azambacteria bacterium RIFCSPLOWO2_01_FULL_46_25 TaxID=1797298 RepID=A0A1F5BVV2_9BACT|nr:MAG: hypothetical protein A3C91_04975 [Candidatus Azambacteria bacterium RIFCSPHIGHO2_02_FULL_52_12]OGD34742.1 MAG: hypothetical protein A2988_04585 [Candidatus Azambacteria bacterium RIFCSPLOWO2_01_FULL_46_25]OGD36950.1 MAG: hypothetical protein A2850_00860 [Candidatus Azambacteria bacterium RIFCSPHIGHO2_01_FULL_51_74]
MRKGWKLRELFLIIGAGILLTLFIGDALFTQYVDAAELPGRTAGNYWETVLGASVGTGGYDTHDCQPDCTNHIGDTSRWQVKGQLYTMQLRRTYHFDLGVEAGLSNTLVQHLDHRGDANDRLTHLIVMVRTPLFTKPGIAGSTNLYGGLGPGWAKTQIVLNNDQTHVAHHGTFVAVAGAEYLISRTLAVFAEFQHVKLGNSTFEIPRGRKKPRTLSLDREINTVNFGIVRHF